MPIVFLNTLENVYEVYISIESILLYILLITYTYMCILVGYSFKFKMKYPRVKKFEKIIIFIFLVGYVLFWLFENGSKLLNYGIFLALSGGSVSVGARLDASGGIDRWFTISLISGIILPIIIRSMYGSKIGQLFPASLSLLGGSKFLFFANLLTLIDNNKLSTRNITFLLAISICGLYVFSILKDISFLDAPLNIMRRLILLPGYICMIKIEFAESLNSFTTIAREAYQIGWGWSGAGGAPSLVFVDLYASGAVGWFVQLTIFGYILGLFLQFFNSLCNKSNLRTFKVFPWLLLLYSSGTIIILKLIILYSTIYIFGPKGNSFERTV